MAKADFKIGADPEFGFINDNGEGITPSSIFDDPYEDSNLTSDAEFGIDGGGDVAEIRPKPSTDPLKVVANIRKAMYKGIKENADTDLYEWKAGSAVSGAAIGGHIHFGIKDTKKYYNLGDLLTSLDRYLALPLLLLEDPEEADIRRNDNEYGGLSDERDQPWGFEYRTPSSWLTSPYVASGVLCLAKAIVWEVLYNGLGAHHDVKIDEDKFYNADLDPIRTQFNKIAWPDIRRFELYSKYKQPINIINMLISKKRNWFPSCGMKTAWAISDRVVQESTGKLKSTSLDTIWKGVSA